MTEATAEQAAEHTTTIAAGGTKMATNSSLRSGFLGIFAACSAAAASSGLCAQEAPGAAAADDDKAAVEEVVVTGSRVIANGNDSPTPVTVLSLDELQQANPGNVTTALAMLPSMLGTPNQGGQSATNFMAILNLRGMGGARNLVLFDGHRLQPNTVLGGILSGVDSNHIPTMLLKRVDVVTGGASAVYGSDAVSGVINYIVDNDFNGVKINAQQSISTYGDARAYNLGIAAGTSLFAGRGHVEFSLQRIVDPGVPDRFDRPWGRELWSMQGSVVPPAGTPAAAVGGPLNPFMLVKDSRFGVTTFGGLINTGPLADLQFASNGALGTFNHGTRTGSSPLAEIGGDGAWFTTYPAFGVQEQTLGFGRFDFSFTDTTKAYFEMSLGNVLNDNPLTNTEVRTRAVGYNNAFLTTIQPQYRALLPAALQAGPNALGTIGAAGSFNFSRIFQPDQVPAQANNTVGKTQLYLAGLDGAWGNYRWNLGLEHADTNLNNRNPYNISNARLYAAMNAVVNPANGQVVCNAALVNPTVYGDCVPLNLFGPSATNAAALKYITRPTEFDVNYVMNDVSASITGAPISSWAGPIEMALSAEWRQQTYELISNAQTTDPVNCTGIQFNCNSGTTPYVGTVRVNFPKATSTVSEFAYEAQVPLLKDVFLAKSLSLNGAVRNTSYSLSDVVYTWKLGLTWALNDSLSFRGTRSRDIRAPDQQALFQPESCVPDTFVDIHTNNTSGTVLKCTTGSLDLKPEQADTYTLGMVWTPSFIEGLSVAVDGYYINLFDGLTDPAPVQPASQALCEVSGGTAPICAFYIRPFPFSDRSPANFPTVLVGSFINVGGIFLKGVDFDIGYTHQLAGRKFGARLLANYQPTLIYDQGPNGVFEQGGAAGGVGGLAGTPDLKGMLQLNYEVFSGFTATVQERYRGAMRPHGSALLYFADSVGEVPSLFLTDVNFGYKLQWNAGGTDLFLNVRNVLNTKSPVWAGAGASPSIGGGGGYVLGDDPIGRYFTLGMRHRF
jgi:iron complex outermembrane receptor protein